MSASIVHVVDDDSSFARAMFRLLSAAGFDVRAHASAVEFLADVRPDDAGCVLLDLDLPGMGGLELQKRIAESANPLPVVFLSGTADVPDAVQAMRDGAVDFLTKRADLGEILRAIETALARDRDERERRGRRRALKVQFGSLSPREREVLALVLRGLTNRTIAEQLGVHERTVKLRRTGITRKLGMRSAAKLVRLADEAGIDDEAEESG